MKTTSLNLSELALGDIFSFQDESAPKLLGLRAARHGGSERIEGVVTFAQGTQVIPATFRPLELLGDLVVQRVDEQFTIQPDLSHELKPGEIHPPGSLVLDSRDRPSIIADDEFKEARLFAFQTGLERQAHFQGSRSFAAFTMTFGAMSE